MAGVILTTSGVTILSTKAVQSRKLTTTNVFISNLTSESGNPLSAWLNDNGGRLANHITRHFVNPMCEGIDSTLNNIKVPFYNDFRNAFPEAIRGKLILQCHVYI